ncbi:Hypothetical_protein [Hexamita inflata]|uniref:Hypothetical_protein n=1 Tax=Hexamita inflata TaxID=28002 RepID=A0AA86NM32_9EUKA|nr:Hypothetical protein HINF_LOCUS9158 [Hexamita inflata]CAI9963116.1 Hypothetical protein HINF_LOCUS50761 [Hexamita inflata]
MTLVDDIIQYIHNVIQNVYSPQQELEILQRLSEQSTFENTIYEIINQKNFTIPVLILINNCKLFAPSQVNLDTLLNLCLTREFSKLATKIIGNILKYNTDDAYDSYISEFIKHNHDSQHLLTFLANLSHSCLLPVQILEVVTQLIEQSDFNMKVVFLKALNNSDLSDHFMDEVISTFMQSVEQLSGDDIDGVLQYLSLTIDTYTGLVKEYRFTNLMQIVLAFSSELRFGYFFYSVLTNPLTTAFLGRYESNIHILVESFIQLCSNTQSEQTEFVQTVLKSLFENSFQLQKLFKQQLIIALQNENQNLFQTAVCCFSGFDLGFDTDLLTFIFKFLLQQLELNRSPEFILTFLKKQTEFLGEDVYFQLISQKCQFYYLNGTISQQLLGIQILKNMAVSQARNAVDMPQIVIDIVKLTFQHLLEPNMFPLRMEVFDLLSITAECYECPIEFVELGTDVCQYLCNNEFILEIKERLVQPLTTSMNKYDFHAQEIFCEQFQHIVNIIVFLLKQEFQNMKLLNFSLGLIQELFPQLLSCAQTSLQQQQVENPDFPDLGFLNELTMVLCLTLKYAQNPDLINQPLLDLIFTTSQIRSTCSISSFNIIANFTSYFDFAPENVSKLLLLCQDNQVSTSARLNCAKKWAQKINLVLHLQNQTELGRNILQMTQFGLEHCRASEEEQLESSEMVVSVEFEGFVQMFVDQTGFIFFRLIQSEEGIWIKALRLLQILLSKGIVSEEIKVNVRQCFDDYQEGRQISQELVEMAKIVLM